MRLGKRMRKLLVWCMAWALLVTAIPVPQTVWAAGREFLKDVEQQPDEYISICTPEDLRAIEAKPDGKYMLMNDIELSGDWTPLCNDQRFTGVLEGNGCTIRGLNISAEVVQGGDYAIGLFARASDAKIRNLVLEGQITVNKGPQDWISEGNCYVGGLIGQAFGGIRIDNCVTKVDVTVNATDEGVFEFEGYAGLIGGHLGGGGAARVDFCRNLGNITGNSPYLAGVIGDFKAGGAILSVTYCVNEGKIEGTHDLAGVIGDTGGEGYIISCVNKGSVIGDYNLAGIVSYLCPYVELTDCLNMGTITVRNGGVTGAGIVAIGDHRKIARCINVGVLENQNYGAIATVNAGTIEDCYYLSGTLYGNEGGRFPADSQDTTGLITKAEMAEEKTFTNFDFEKKWTLDTELGHPYPTALMSEEVENAYKARYVENMMALAETAKYSELMTNSGGGSMAGMLAEAYEKAGVVAESNAFWSMATKIKDLLQWNVEIENEFDLIIAELLAGTMSEDIWADEVSNEVLEAISDFATYYTESMEPLAEEEIHEVLKSMADNKTLYNSQFREIFQKLNTLLAGHADALKTAEKFIGTVGGVVSSMDALGAGCLDVGEYMNYYALCTGYVKATSSYAEILIESANACEALGQWPDTTKDLQKAVKTLEETIGEAATGDKEVLFRACAEEAGEAILGVGGNILDIIGVFGKRIPVIAGSKAGIQWGVSLSNQFTSMDDVAFYGKMMYMIGVLSQGMHQVVIDREVAFENSGEYEEAKALSEAIDMYLNLQIIACDYAIGYFNALCSAEITKLLDFNDSDGKAPWFLREEQEMILLLKEEKNRLVQLKESGQSIYVGLDGTIGGFIIACPVTVVVETKEGEEIARLETGKMTLADGIDGNYAILGAEGQHKIGFFDPEEHNLKIIGEEDGTMNVAIYYGEEGELTENYDLPNVSVKKGETYTWNGTELTQGSGVGNLLGGGGLFEGGDSSEGSNFSGNSGLAGVIGAVAVLGIGAGVFLLKFRKRK